jgi:hypothetical protein
MPLLLLVCIREVQTGTPDKRHSMSGVFVKYAAQNPKKNSRDHEAPLIPSAPMIAWPDRGFQKKNQHLYRKFSFKAWRFALVELPFKQEEDITVRNATLGSAIR